jgi:signal transduction histidine kinase/CheY-like chemotaxis protein
MRRRRPLQLTHEGAAVNSPHGIQPAAAHPESERIQAEQIRTLYRTAAAALNIALVGALVLCGVLLYIDAQTPRVLGLWLAFVCADFALRQGSSILFLRLQPPDRQWRAWARWYTLATLCGGLVWGIGAVWLMTPDTTQQLVVMLFISATASGAVPAFGSWLPAVWAYVVPAMLPFMLWSATRGDPLHQALTLMGFVFSSAFLLLGWRFNANLVEALRLRFENIDLLEDVQRQKALAEQANVAKSRFLAAASHDLRQPVHALGLFLGALRRRSMDDEARRMVEHLDGSVEALDGLFAALLDISRLDAGIVQSHRQAFAIQPMLDRVCEDHAAEAQAKGLRLLQHRSAAVVHSDPVLVERIVRNIVSNAVRYTDQGGVLVGCRRGARLSIEVWDTGRGISPEQQLRVFEEFYQVGNPERDRAKGLGLGLAIVKRLSALLDCPLTLASEPGRGSVFKLSVPLYDGSGVEEGTSSDAAPLAPSPGLILVIDDELAIQDAMRSLLTDWGHEVITAGSCEEMLARVADRQTRPDLIICDYRLRGAENGIEVIERLQSEYNHDIPAMLVTGDTGPERLHEAQRSGYLLLHKPVPRGKLRAAIGNLMSDPAADAEDA